MIPIHQRLAWFARTRPEEVAMVDEQGSLTFREADQLARRMAAALRASGLRPGDRFVLLAANRREGLLAFMAASASGAVLTPLNTRLASGEIAEIVQDAAPRLVLADGEGAAILAPVFEQTSGCQQICLDGPRPGWTGVETWLEAAAEATAPDLPWEAARPLFQMYTSGTTGRPAGIVIAQGAWAAQIEQFHRTQPYQPGDGVLVVTPLFHIAAAITATSALLAGARVELPARFRAPEVLDLLNEGRVAGTMMVPAMIGQLVDDAARRGVDRVRGVRRICYGASPITEPLLRQALHLFGCDFIQGYGLTETAGVATTLSPEDHVRALDDCPGLLRAAGRAVMGAEVRVMHPDGAAAAAGEIGEVQIRGPNMFLGYWRNPDKSRAAWTDDGWFRSGDAGRLDSEGYLYIVDRIKDLIITGGENVYPQEVERVLGDHPSVRECAVFGLPDPKWGESVVAAIVPRAEPPIDEDSLRSHALARLARFKCPSRYVVVKELPRNATGKIMRRALASATGQGAAA